MKNLYLIGGTMGVGKTTVCRMLKKKMEKAVFLDGDWCWDADPFVVTDETKYFSGVHDSFKATGKERVEFTVNGEKRIDDIYIGDLPEIISIECEKEIPAKHIILTLEYSGLSEEIEVKRSCVLSEGYKAVNELFRDLQPGDYRFYVSVSSENKEYSGTSRFDFDVVD